MTEQNIMDILFLGSLVNILMALTIAGLWQELKAIRINQANIKEAQMAPTNYARKIARLAMASKVIQKY